MEEMIGDVIVGAPGLGGGAEKAGAIEGYNVDFAGSGGVIRALKGATRGLSYGGIIKGSGGGRIRALKGATRGLSYGGIIKGSGGGIGA